MSIHLLLLLSVTMVAAGVIGGSPCRPRSPRLMLAEPGSSAARRLGHRLVDAYLELVAARLRPNSTLAIAYDLKVFFTVIDKDPLEVRRADIVSFVREQRTSRDGTNVVRLTDGWPHE